MKLWKDVWEGDTFSISRPFDVESNVRLSQWHLHSSTQGYRDREVSSRRLILDCGSFRKKVPTSLQVWIFCFNEPEFKAYIFFCFRFNPVPIKFELEFVYDVLLSLKYVNWKTKVDEMYLGVTLLAVHTCNNVHVPTIDQIHVQYWIELHFCVLLFDRKYCNIFLKYLHLKLLSVIRISKFVLGLMDTSNYITVNRSSWKL